MLSFGPSFFLQIFRYCHAILPWLLHFDDRNFLFFDAEVVGAVAPNREQALSGGFSWLLPRRWTFRTEWQFTFFFSIFDLPHLVMKIT